MYNENSADSYDGDQVELTEEVIPTGHSSNLVKIASIPVSLRQASFNDHSSLSENCNDDLPNGSKLMIFTGESQASSGFDDDDDQGDTIALTRIVATTTATSAEQPAKDNSPSPDGEKRL